MFRIFLVIALSTAFSSCVNNSSNDLAIYKSLNEGSEKSIETMGHANDLIYIEFENKKIDPETSERAVRWSSKVDSIRNLSKVLAKYIRYLKFDVVNLAASENDIRAVEKIFNNGKTDELFEKISEYKKNMLNLNEEFRKTFWDRKSILTTGIDTLKANFRAKYFDKKPAIAVLGILSMLENNLKIMENDFITFCNYKVIPYDDGISVFGTLINQSSNYIKAGDKMEISAGIGDFTVVNKPVITINGKFFHPDYSTNGVAVYKFITPSKAGKYSVPVKFEYIGADGRKQYIENKVDYTVVE